MADSFLSGFIEVFQQPDKPATCESHGPRSLPSCRNKRPEKIMYDVDRQCWLAIFQLLSEFVGHEAGRSHSQYNEVDLTVSLATARHGEV